MPVYCSKSFLRVSPCRFQVLVNPPSRHWSNNAKHQTPHDRPPVLWAVEGTGAKFSHLWAKQLAYQLLCGQSPNKTTEITNLSLRFFNAGVGDDFFRNRDGKKLGNGKKQTTDHIVNFRNFHITPPYCRVGKPKIILRYFPHHQRNQHLLHLQQHPHAFAWVSQR